MTNRADVYVDGVWIFSFPLTKFLLPGPGPLRYCFNEGFLKASGFVFLLEKQFLQMGWL